MILGILQVRLSSTRLPGKVLKPILGRPMLWRQLERLVLVRKIDQLLVATSDQPEDTQLGALCEEIGVACYFGDLNDVLDRFYQAARPLNPEHVVRLTGDCPLIDPGVVDSVIRHHLKGCYDYTSNTIEPTFPDGLDVEVMSFGCLETAWQEATLPSEREHVTSFIWNQPRRFRIGSVKAEQDLSHLRWTVDEPEDFELITLIYEALYRDNPQFGYRDVLKLLDRHPEYSDINSEHQRNRGYRKSLARDKLEAGK